MERAERETLEQVSPGTCYRREPDNQAHGESRGSCMAADSATEQPRKPQPSKYDLLPPSFPGTRLPCFLILSFTRVKFKIKNKFEILSRIEYHREEVSQYTSQDPNDEYQAGDYGPSFDNGR